MTEKKRIYSVSEITRSIRVILEDVFSAVWVEGEVSNFKKHTSGHMYFTLKDNTSQLACVIFKGINRNMKFKLEDGMQLICFGKISVYDKNGAYQLYIEQAEPKGVGALQLAFQQLKERLAKEGLFDESHKIPIPFLPTCIGVVTSPTGAAIRDILNVTRRRFSNIDIIINPVRVQGEGAAGEIAGAIRELNRLSGTKAFERQIDVIIVARGGGSLEDLWAFNEEAVARAIYDSEIPVISGVGHEIDYTIADFVADLRAPTPSAAAELAVPRKDDLTQSINAVTEKLAHAVLNRIEFLKAKVRDLKESYVLREPLNLFRQAGQRIDELEKGLIRGLNALLEAKRQALKVSAGKMEALSPLAVLGRGYSITMRFPSGEVIKNSAGVKKGEEVRTLLGEGGFLSVVKEASGR